MGIADIKDTVSITASVTGELPNPVYRWSFGFKELNIPGLHFSKVRGDLHYEDALLKFTNVKGNVLEAQLKLSEIIIWIQNITILTRWDTNCWEALPHVTVK